MFRSSSGHGLSISTSAANASGTQSNLPPPSGALQGKSLFGNTTTSQPQQPSSFFGASKPFLMGNAQATQGTQPPTQNNQQFGNNQQTAGLFGSRTNQPHGGVLFGSQQNQHNSSNIFGSDNKQSQSQQGGGLFGSTLGHNPNSTGFGNIPNQTAPASIFSGSIGQQNKQQTVPGVRISTNELRPTTRFNDLHEDLQRVIEYVDAFVLNKIQWHEQCESANAKLDDMCQQMPPDVEYCTRSLDVVQRALENDAHSIATVKRLVKSDRKDVELSRKVLNNLNQPSVLHHTNLWSTVSVPQQAGPSLFDDASDDESSRDLVEYFSKHVDEMAVSLASYERNIAEVGSYLKGMEVTAMQQAQQLSTSKSRNGGSKNAVDRVRELAAVLRDFENGILVVATKVGAARESAQDAMLGPANDANRSLSRGSRTGFR